MNRLIPTFGVLAFTAFFSRGDTPAAPRTNSAADRLAVVEKQLVQALEEVRALRSDLAGKASETASPAPDTKMERGAIAQCFVRTGGAHPGTMPAPKATPSDERPSVDSTFNPITITAASGYDRQVPVTVLYQGYFKAEEAGVYEFMYSGFAGQMRIGESVITQRDPSVRLQLSAGYHPVEVMAYQNPNESYTPPATITVKRSGLDPLPVTPGSLWHDGSAASASSK